MAMPVLDASTLDADPEGVALIRSVLDTGRTPCAEDEKSPNQRQSEQHRAHGSLKADTPISRLGVAEDHS
jgi:hypothetical protein